MIRLKQFVWLILPMSLACGQNQSSNHAMPLRVFAAASLSTVIPEVAEAFQGSHPDITFEFNFSASSMLAKQLEHGASADLFLSANEQWVTHLQRADIIKQQTDLLTNKLVLITPANREFEITFGDLASASVQRIALADWSHVPAGMYAKQALEKAGLWEAIASKCLPAMDVRAALTYVERGEVDCGIVYRTDAAISNKIQVISELPEQIQPRIRYVVALPKSAEHHMSSTFFTFVTGDTAEAIFTQHGFGVIERE